MSRTNNPIYFPLLASENINQGGQSPEEIHSVWSRFDVLPQNIKDILSAQEMPEKISRFQDTFRCSDEAIESVSVLIRWYFFGQIDKSSFQRSVQDVLGEVNQDMMNYFESEIFSLRPKVRKEEQKEKKESSQTIQLPLLQALSKYSQLGNQLITKERIKIKSQVEPVRPSLIYWLKYYRDELGVGHHDSVQRGQFLFRSENGKKLSPEERERVNLILKSVEENLPLDIDTAANEIVFPRFEAPSVKPVVQPQSALSHFAFEAPVREQVSRTPERAFPTGQTVPLPAQKAPLPGKGMISFSSPHVFQAEKEEVEPKKVPTFNTNPFHIRPVSMQDDEE